MNFVRHILLAVQFFTRIPITGPLADWVGYSPAMLRASAAHFPAIGWLAGGLAAGVFWALSQALGPSPWSAGVAAVACTVATVMMTGGFHEDGLADVADGLGGSYDRERALDIMKDSRVGAFGAMALQLGLISKVAVLSWLGQASLALVVSALLLGHVLSRLWPLWLVRTLPHVGDTARSKSKPLADQISGPALGAAVLWCLPPLLLLGWQLGPSLVGAGVLAGALALVYMGRLFRRRLQGFTGDCLGATQQVCEIATYLGLAIAWAQQSAA